MEPVTEKFNNGLCTHCLGLHGLKSSRNRKSQMWKDPKNESVVSMLCKTIAYPVHRRPGLRIRDKGRSLWCKCPVSSGKN